MNQVQDILIPYENMLKAGMHFGRRKTVFNPAMGKYVFTVRDGICIIDLLLTQEKLKSMIEFLQKSVSEGKLILFVAPTTQSREATKTLAESLGMPYVLDRWIGGTLTNFKVINSRVKKLEDMERAKANGELEKYTKKERMMFDKEMTKMSHHYEGLKKLTRLPDIVFVSSVKEGHLPVAEARKIGITLAGIVNTDADPKTVQYAVPANDRSKISLDLILNAIAESLKNSQTK
jgi:small subunit ribosomal protein S2